VVPRNGRLYSALVLKELPWIMELRVQDIEKGPGEIPDEPGCYIFKAARKPLYVGKAKSLRKRLKQYFGGKRFGDPKTRALLEHATSLELILTANETEALLLEMNLIRKYRPKYNVTISGFPYIKISKEKYPRIFVTREAQDKRTGRYVGPFTDATAIRQTVALTNRAFGLRTCKYELDKKPPRRACLDYEIGVCRGPCVGAISRTDYATLVEKALKFITGSRAGVMRELEKRMAAAAADLSFEEAAAWRDVIRGLNRAVADQYAVANKNTNADAVACDVRGDALYGVVLRVREGRLVDRVAVKADAPAGNPLEEFLLGHYGAGAEVPAKVAVPRNFGGRLALEASLAEIRGGRVTLFVPRWGEYAHLVDVARKNLEYFVEISELSRARRGELSAVFEELGAALGLEEPPRRLEMVDISNTGPKSVVGSLIVFVDGVPDKNSYRRYRIKTVTGQDDPAAIAEVVRRRFARVRAGEGIMPDLFLVDGGPNQLNAALKALENAGFGAQTAAAFAKDPDRLFAAGEREPAPISEAASLFLARVRDEAHRFAVEYHRAVRGRAATRSILDEVKGIGPARKKSLLKHFGSLEKVMSATAEELAASPGMNARVADNLHEYLHGGRERDER
jgi:excinuclease ABC subunit C